MGPLDDPMADDFFIPNPPLCFIYMFFMKRIKIIIKGYTFLCLQYATMYHQGRQLLMLLINFK